MPRNDWQTNTIEHIFGAHYPHGKVKSVLDVGCGLALKSQFIKADMRVGVDIHRPYLERGSLQVKADVAETLVLINDDVLCLDQRFLPKSFDVVLLLDVIEHFDKATGYHLLHMCEQIARVAVCVETPLGFVPQNMDILGMGGAHWQTHRSGWTPQDFQGYHVVVRDYEMSDVQRHTDVYQPPQIQMIDAIKRMD